MKKAFEKNGRTSNRHALRLLTIVSILSGIAIISIFYWTSMDYIHSRAETLLTEFMSSEERDSGWLLPELDVLSTDDMEEKDILNEEEKELLTNYLEKRKYMPYYEIQRFRWEKYEIYFFPMASGQIGQKASEDTVLLVCADVSFAVDMVRKTTRILVAAMVFVAFCLFAVERKMVKILNEKDEGMKNFFANVSHELKTPLMALKGYTDGLENGLVSREDACAVMSRETERMEGLIGTILEFSKLESGVVTPHMEVNDVREILYDAMQIIMPTADERQVSVTFELPCPILFSCDEEMLFSVFSNLMTNCVRYAKSNIFISACCLPDRKMLTVSISNDGTELAEEDMSHMFERFYKGSNGQTGIGLALSQEYVRLHHGELSVSVEEGRTVFQTVFGASHKRK